MIVKDMFQIIDYEKIWDAIYKNYFSLYRYREKIDYFKKSLEKTVLELLDTKPIINSNWIMFFDSCVDEIDTTETKTFYDAYLFSKNDIIKNFNIDDIVEKSIDISSWSLDKIKEYFHSREELISWGLEFAPWNEALGYTVDEESIKEIGLENCTAVILFEMTYCGFTQEKCAEKIEKIFTKNRYSDLPSNEELDDVDISDLIEMESDEDIKKSYIHAHQNWCSLYWKLKKYVEDN